MASAPLTSHLTSAELKSLRELLEKKRTELQSRALGHLAIANESEANLAEPMDQATREFDLGDRLDLATRESVLLTEVEAALARMSEGVYGLSEESGEQIPFGRLQALPWTRLTAREEEVLERALREHR